MWSRCGIFVVGNPWVLAFEKQEERGMQLPCCAIGGLERSAGVVSTASRHSSKVHHCGWPDVL